MSLNFERRYPELRTKQSESSEWLPLAFLAILQVELDSVK